MLYFPIQYRKGNRDLMYSRISFPEGASSRKYSPAVGACSTKVSVEYTDSPLVTSSS